jgi:hypothetical protein
MDHRAEQSWVVKALEAGKPLLGRADAVAQATVINALQRSAATDSAWMVRHHDSVRQG